MVSWWRGLSRAYQNAFALLGFNGVVFLGFILGFAPLVATWESLTGFLPNIFLGVALPFLGFLRSVTGSGVASVVVVDAVTMLLSLLAMHLIVGFGLGFLFDHIKRSRAWDFVNFLVLIVVLFVIHFFLIVATYL